jgi:hypothetical protein
MADSANRCARIMIQSRVRQLHPDWTDEERHREFLRKFLGRGSDRYLAARR